MNIALYGRINAGKDTAANMLFYALSFWKNGMEREVALGTDIASIEQMLNLANLDNLAVDLIHSNITFGELKPFRYIKFMSFSTRIHEMTCLLTGVPLKQCVDRKFKDTLVPRGFHKTIRQIMIDIGEGLRASYGTNVWVAPVMNTIEDNPDSLMIVPGMRHPNEYSALASLGNTIFVNVKSDFEIVKGAEFAEGLLEDHKFDVVLHNKKGDLTYLWNQVVNMVYTYSEKITLDYAN